MLQKVYMIKVSRNGLMSQIRGKICFINMVEPEEGEKLFEKYKAINWVLG